MTGDIIGKPNSRNATSRSLHPLAADPNRPTVEVDRDWGRALDQAIQAAAADERLFIRHGKLVERAGEEFSPVGARRLACLLSDRLAWVKQSREGTIPTSCPLSLASSAIAVMPCLGYPEPRWIDCFMQGPTLDLAGNLINRDGYYDFGVGNLGWWQSGAIPGFGERLQDPGHSPRQFALEQIESLRNEGFRSIPWANSETDWARFLGFLFALILRPTLARGPFHLISGDSSDCGVGALAAAAHRIAHGDAPLANQAWPKRPAQQDSMVYKICQAAEAGAPSFYFADIPKGTVLLSYPLNALITSGGDLRTRQRGRNDGSTVGGPHRIVFCGSGIDISPSESFEGRCIKIRLKASSSDSCSNAGQSGFRGPGELLSWLSDDENRVRCLTYAISALRAYFLYLKNGGEPMKGMHNGYFLDYSKYIAKAVIFATVTDPLFRHW